jgi:hypothetical protein
MLKCLLPVSPLLRQDRRGFFRKLLQEMTTHLDSDGMKVLVDRVSLELREVEIDGINDRRALLEEAVRLEMLFRGGDVFGFRRTRRVLSVRREDLRMKAWGEELNADRVDSEVRSWREWG